MAENPTPEDILSELEGRSRKFETPCGNGSVVWRVWGNGPPLLLAHGSHGSWMHWVRNIDSLADKRSVWAVDLPGWGDSTAPAQDGHAAISDALACGLRQLIPTSGGIDMVGFSFGASALAHLAMYHPDLVRRLILIDAGGLGTPVHEIQLRRVRGLDDAGRRIANRANLLAIMLLHCDSVDDLALHIQAIGASKAKIDPVPYVLPDMALKALANVTAQIDAIWGEYDQPHPDPAAQEKVLRSIDPDIDFEIIADAGHWVMYERPQAFNAALHALLDKPLRKIA